MVKTTLFTLLLLAAAGCNMKNSAPSESPPSGIIVDVRTPAERSEFGYIAASVGIVHTEIHTEIAKVAPDKRTPIAVYCRSGRRSAMAAEVLKNIGYKNVTDLGGFEEAQKKLSLPIVKVK